MKCVICGRNLSENLPGAGYHNKQWAEKMVNIGLVPTDTGQPGGKQTGQSITHLVAEGGAFETAYDAMKKDLILPFVSIEYHAYTSAGTDENEEIDEENEEKKKAAEKNKKVKYSCPGCEINVWGKPELNLHCNDCEQDLTAS